MRVFKFGGASVKDAESVRNACEIIKKQTDEKLVIVISAMGKMTNKLEQLVDAFYKNKDTSVALNEVKEFHDNILLHLFGEGHEVFEVASKIYSYFEKFLEIGAKDNYSQVYDQIVPVGELLSTKIVHAYFEAQGINCNWIDIRKVFKTDNSYQKALVDWETTLQNCKETFAKNGIYITQGFIASGEGNYMTTLGREGSDYSAAILANCLDSESVTIWKDVDGVLNADPKFFNNTIKLSNISYKEAIELAYYGASVIHPKTIKPLQNKSIPLIVRSFLNPEIDGTTINHEFKHDAEEPSFIFKSEQALISITPKDFSFIDESNLSEIFKTLARLQIEVSVMQNSAINFSIVTNFNEGRINDLIEKLNPSFKVLYNQELELLTIRHYTPDLISLLSKDKELLLEQRTRNTVRLVMR